MIRHSADPYRLAAARRECQEREGCPDSPTPCPECPVARLYPQNNTAEERQVRSGG